ncbi:MAG: alpha/beta hydrolase family protein, partial [Bacteroidota bacterium]
PAIHGPSRWKLPVVYLLHGWSGNHRQWAEIADLQQLANQYRCLIVCPDGFFDSWYVNSPRLPDHQYEDYFVQELHPFIRTQYTIDTAKVFISGLSMGGHGALYLFARHPELFRSAGSTSGGLDLRYRAGKLGLERIIGPQTAADPIWAEYSVIDHAGQIAKAGKPIIFDCGTGDFFLEINRKFKARCDALGIPATYTEQPGKHNREYWRMAIPSHFAFFFRPSAINR